MNKCFEGIQKLKFKDDLKIEGMYSALGEYVEFNEIIDPIHIKTKDEIDEERVEKERELINSGEDPDSISVEIKKTSIRNIEIWLKETEDQMKESLMTLALKASADEKITPRKEWLMKWAG